MSEQHHQSSPLTAAADALRAINNGALLAERDRFWAAGNMQAALALDDARHGVSRALQDMRRAEARITGVVVPGAHLATTETDRTRIKGTLDELDVWALCFASAFGRRPTAADRLIAERMRAVAAEHGMRLGEANRG